jgi:hypothetical protein
MKKIQILASGPELDEFVRNVQLPHATGAMITVSKP